jgi:histidine phosphotransferase ChpT
MFEAKKVENVPAPKVVLDELDLAALISSRICHDVISPVGAINNGLEVLEDENDEDMRKIAMELVKKSARQASSKLQFCRLAFGAAGSAGAEIDTGDAESVARGFVEGDKVTLEWQAPRQLLPKNRVKLLLNLMMIAANAIPRGGRITFVLSANAAGPVFTINCQGLNARLPPQVLDLLQGQSATGIDSHTIQPYYTGLVAVAAGMSLNVTSQGDTVRIVAAC